MRRVTIVTDRLHGSGGSERQVFSVAQGLAAAGWRIHLVHEAGGDLERRWAEMTEVQTRVAKVPFSRRHLRTFPGAANTAMRDRRRFASEIVYVHRLSHVALLAGARVPMVFHVHDHPPRPTAVRRLTARRPVRCVFVSRAIEMAWKSHFPCRAMSVVPNGIELDDYVPLGEHERERVRTRFGGGLVVGAIVRDSPEKGLDVAVDAVAAIDGAVLVVAGVLGEETIRSATQRLGSRFQPLGYLQDPWKQLGAVDVVVVPSRRESFGLAALEGMAMGRPVVATSVGGLPELLGAFPQSLVPPDDPAAMAEAIRQTSKADGSEFRTIALGYRREEMVDRIVGLLDAAAGTVTAS